MEPTIEEQIPTFEEIADSLAEARQEDPAPMPLTTGSIGIIQPAIDADLLHIEGDSIQIRVPVSGKRRHSPPVPAVADFGYAPLVPSVRPDLKLVAAYVAMVALSLAMVVTFIVLAHS